MDLNGNALPADTTGYDSEGLVALADGTFWVSDEYGPFITHFDATGRAIERLSPVGASPTLPVELANRLENRGMEGLTLTPDGTQLVGIMQSALNQPDVVTANDDPKKIAAVRIVVYTLATGAVREYLYMLDNPSTTGTGVSEITALTNTTFLVDERDGKFPPNTYKKLYKIDLAGATDIGPNTSVPGSYETTGGKRGLVIGGNSVEELIRQSNTASATSTLAANGITPVGKSFSVDIGSTLQSLNSAGAFFSHDKIEGVAAMGNFVVIANDSDFGIDGVTNTTSPYQLHAKTSPATGAQDDGEFLVIDTTRLPALTATATVTINVSAAPDPVVYNGVDSTFPVLADGDPTPVDFGSSNVGQNVSRTFAIKNNGTANLTGLTPTIDGANSDDFIGDHIAGLTGGSRGHDDDGRAICAFGRRNAQRGLAHREQCRRRKGLLRHQPFRNRCRLPSTLAAWDVHAQAGGVNNFGPSPLGATFSDSHVTVGGLTRGSGVSTTGTGAARGWGGVAWLSTGFHRGDQRKSICHFFGDGEFGIQCFLQEHQQI